MRFKSAFRAQNDLSRRRAKLLANNVQKTLDQGKMKW